MMLNDLHLKHLKLKALFVQENAAVLFPLPRCTNFTQLSTDMEVSRL